MTKFLFSCDTFLLSSRLSTVRGMSTRTYDESGIFIIDAICSMTKFKTSYEKISCMLLFLLVILAIPSPPWPPSSPPHGACGAHLGFCRGPMFSAVIPLAHVVGRGGGPLAQPPSLRERWARAPALLLLVTKYRVLPLPSLPPDHPFPFSDWI